MAPLPMFHRPLSLDNSRETSLSSGRGGVLSGPDTSNDSGGGISLPLSAAGGSTAGGSSIHKQPSIATPDTPSTAHTLAGGNSSDYLVPVAGVGGSNGSISTLPQDPPIVNTFQSQKSNGATSRKPLNPNAQPKMPNRDQRKRSSGHHGSNNGSFGQGYPSAPSTPSDNEAESEVLRGKSGSRRQSRGSSYAGQKSGSRDSLRYNNPNLQQAETSFSYSPEEIVSVTTANVTNKSRKRSPGVTYTTLSSNKQQQLYDDRRSSSGSSSQHGYAGGKSWHQSGIAIPQPHEGNDEERAPLFPPPLSLPLVSSRNATGDNSSTSSSSYSGQQTQVRNSSRSIPMPNPHSHIVDSNRHIVQRNNSNPTPPNRSATVIANQQILPVPLPSNSKLASSTTADNPTSKHILEQPSLSMIGASPPEGYGNEVVPSRIADNAPSPILPPLPPLPVDDSPVQLDVASLAIGPGGSRLHPMTNISSSAGSLRYTKYKPG